MRSILPDGSTATGALHQVIARSFHRQELSTAISPSLCLVHTCASIPKYDTRQTFSDHHCWDCRGRKRSARPRAPQHTSSRTSSPAPEQASPSLAAFADQDLGNVLLEI